MSCFASAAFEGVRVRGGEVCRKRRTAETKSDWFEPLRAYITYYYGPQTPVPSDCEVSSEWVPCDKVQTTDQTRPESYKVALRAGIVFRGLIILQRRTRQNHDKYESWQSRQEGQELRLDSTVWEILFRFMIFFRLEFMSSSSSSWLPAVEHSLMLIWWWWWWGGGGGGVRKEERTKLEIDDDALESFLLSALLICYLDKQWSNLQIAIRALTHRRNELNRSSWNSPNTCSDLLSVALRPVHRILSFG